MKQVQVFTSIIKHRGAREHGRQGVLFRDSGERPFGRCLKSGLTEKTALKTSRERLFAAESGALANVPRPEESDAFSGVRRLQGLELQARGRRVTEARRPRARTPAARPGRGLCFVFRGELRPRE